VLLVTAAIRSLFIFMAKSRQTKVEEIKELVGAVSDAEGIVFANFAGLTVSDINDLRRRCREADVQYFVAKKTLLKIAFEKAGVDAIDAKQLSGSVAAVFGKDEVVAAKILNEFAKTHESLQFVSGALPKGGGWQALSAAEVEQLADLPSKTELIGQMVGTLTAPLRGFVTVLSGPSRSLVQVLSAISQAKA